MGCPCYSYLWILSRMLRRKLSVTSSCGFKLSCLVKRHLCVWWADTFRRGRNVISVCWFFVICCWNNILKPWTGVLSLFAAVFRTQRSFRGSVACHPERRLRRRLWSAMLPTNLFNNCSSTPNGLWVNSLWGRKSSLSVKKNYWDKTSFSS